MVKVKLYVDNFTFSSDIINKVYRNIELYYMSGKRLSEVIFLNRKRLLETLNKPHHIDKEHIFIIFLKCIFLYLYLYSAQYFHGL